MVTLISILLIFLSFSIWHCEKYMVFEYDLSRTSLKPLVICSNNCAPWLKGWTREVCTGINTCNAYTGDLKIPVELQRLSININVEFRLSSAPGICNTMPGITSCFNSFHPYLTHGNIWLNLKVPESKGWFPYKTWFKYIKRQEIQLPHPVPRIISVYIGFLNLGTLNQVKISIESCLQKVTNLVSYPLSAVEVRVNGTCLPNAIQLNTSDALSAFCNYTTGYHSFQGGCQCKPGFMFINDSCTACTANEYKPQPGNQECYKCGNNSSRQNGSNHTCLCQNGYRRKYNESKDSSKPCFEKKLFGQCGYEKIYVSFNEIYTFPLFLIGHVQKFSCIHGQTDEAERLNKSVILERKCVLSREDKAVWTDLDLSSCAHKKEFNISDMSPEDVNNETAADIAQVLSKLTSHITNMNNEKTLSDTTKILKAILKLQRKDPKVRRNVLKIMDNILRIDSQIISSTNTSDDFFNFLDIIANNTDNNYQFSGNQFSVRIKVTTQPFNVNAHVLYEQSISFDINVNINESKVDALIPEAVFKEQNLSQGQKIVFYAFKDDKLFNQNRSKGDIGSFIMAVSIEGVKIENLETPIRFNFQTKRNISDNSTGQCVFWDEELQGGSWSKRGCITSRDPDRTDVTVCKCDHLTNFAILFNVFEDNEKELKWGKELYLVSQIGCTLSMVFLTATLIAYLRFEVLRKRTAQKILLNFSSSLLILLVIFTAVVNLKRPSSALCQSMSTLLHLFILSTFCWSAVQALFLYKKAVRSTKNRGENKRAYWICFCLAWGIPIITSLSVGFASKSQFADPIPTLCILNGSVFTYTITVPVSIIVVSNLLVFFPIMHQIQKHITVRANFKHNDNPLRRRIKVTFGCIVLLGLTWLFGFMAIGEAREIIHWLFNITNTLQGVFVFVFYVILNDEVKNVWKTYFTAMTNTDSAFVIQSNGAWHPAKSHATSELSQQEQDVVLTSKRR